MTRSVIFVVQMFWLLFLGALAAAYFIQRESIPVGDYLGSVPLGVVWFGALGAVLISLTGIVEHADDWKPSFALWHISRPFVGASLAVVGVLIIQAGVLSSGAPLATSQDNKTTTSVTGTTSSATGATTTAGGTTTSAAGNTTSTNSATPGSPAIPKNLLYFLVAFLVGYREETFRELIKRLIDLIFKPTTPEAPPTITGIAPPHGPIAGGVPVVISGSNLTGTTTVTFGSSAATFHVDSDNKITAQLPSATDAAQVTVTVKGKGGSATASFNYP